MVIRTVAGAPTGEDVEDLRSWLLALPGAPQVHEVVQLSCAQHAPLSATWFYVEADAGSGLARRRCLACGTSVAMLDSDERWTHPQMVACGGCGTSICEVAVGLHLPDGAHVEWVAVGARCVECGRLAGLTDLVVDRLPVEELLGRV